jgi:uncharacterized protein
MPDLLPLFPLPNIVLFPNVFLPLHIFEPRYLQMVADALLGDRLIGMVLLRPARQDGFRDEYDCPPVFPIGCSGVITHVEQLEDGRYNIVLRGLERFRIVEEDHERAYRRAVVESLSEQRAAADDRAALMNQRAKLEALLAAVIDQAGAGVPAGRYGRTAREDGRQARAARSESSTAYAKTTSSMSDEDLVHALAQYLDLEPLEKQALLQHDSLRMRAESLVELLEMKILMARMPGLPNVAH